MRDLIDPLPPRLKTVVDAAVGKGEEPIVCLKGQQLEALIVTETRVIIAKTGYMVGQLFGSNIFQIPLSNVGIVEVKTGFINHYFEVSAAGMAMTRKTRSALDAANSARMAENCVSISDKKMAERFKQACNLITSVRNGPAAVHDQVPSHMHNQVTLKAGTLKLDDLFSSLEKLGSLKTAGILTETEFDSKKQQLLSQF